MHCKQQLAPQLCVMGVSGDEVTISYFGDVTDQAPMRQDREPRDIYRWIWQSSKTADQYVDSVEVKLGEFGLLPTHCKQRQWVMFTCLRAYLCLWQCYEALEDTQRLQQVRTKHRELTMPQASVANLLLLNGIMLFLQLGSCFFIALMAHNYSFALKTVLWSLTLLVAMHISWSL